MTNNDNVRHIEHELINSLYSSLKDDDKWLEIYEGFTKYADQIGHQDQTVAMLLSHIKNLQGLKNDHTHVESLIKQTFDSLPFGIIFLDEALNIIHKNQIAYQLMAQWQCSDSLPQQILNPILEQLRKANTNTLHNHCTINERSIHTSLKPHKNASGCQYVLYIYDDTITLSFDVLNTLYGITRSEARAVNMLIKYPNTKKSAEIQGITVETMRSHIKSLMSRTETHSQPELIIKLLSGPQWLSHISTVSDHIELLKERLISEPIIEIGDTEGKLILYVPSLFSFAWDFLENDLFGWQSFFEASGLCLVILNTHCMMPDHFWRHATLQEISKHVVKETKQWLKDNHKKNQPIQLVASGSGCAIVLNFEDSLPIQAIKMMSPMLPAPYLVAKDYKHKDFHKIALGNRMPENLWFNIAPYLINQISTTPDVYFKRTIANQSCASDIQRVVRWHENPLLVVLFQAYVSRAKYKIAFDLRLINRAWSVTLPSCPIQFIAGKFDIYTNLSGINSFVAQHPNSSVLVYDSLGTALPRQQLQKVFSDWRFVEQTS